MVGYKPVLKIDYWLLLAAVVPSFSELWLHSHETNSATIEWWLLVTLQEQNLVAFGFPFQM